MAITGLRQQTLRDKIMKIQQQLNVPKTHHNAFGGYDYRSVSDILEAVKPLAAEQRCVVVLDDDLVQIGDRFYVKSSAYLLDCDTDEYIVECGFARETLGRPKMDDAQVTGSASSYARKYALNGLFAIDDTVDIDAQEAGDGKAKELTNAEKVALAKKEAAKITNRVQFMAWQQKYMGYLSGDNADENLLAIAKKISTQFPKK